MRYRISHFRVYEDNYTGEFTEKLMSSNTYDEEGLAMYLEVYPTNSGIDFTNLKGIQELYNDGVYIDYIEKEE